MISRETLYSAIFTQWQLLSPGTFFTVSRKLDNFANVHSSIQPALFQLQAGEKVTPQRGLPPKYALALEIFIYAHSDDPTIAPSSQLNPLIDAVLGKLAIDPNTGVCTFGIAGVQHIWVEGEIKIAEGVLENQAIAIIPVNILTI